MLTVRSLTFMCGLFDLHKEEERLLKIHVMHMRDAERVLRYELLSEKIYGGGC